MLQSITLVGVCVYIDPSVCLPRLCSVCISAGRVVVYDVMVFQQVARYRPTVLVVRSNYSCHMSTFCSREKNKTGPTNRNHFG